MAKQRGIHQISGKINNLCYYEQKYVRGGLIRRINEAMSERLKTDPVFANTRRANKIFGGCSKFSSALLEFFGNRSTFLFKPYRHAILTRAVKKYLLEAAYIAGYPNIVTRSLGFKHFPLIINNIVKNSIFNDFEELENYVQNLNIRGSYEFYFYNESLVNFCKKNNCIGVQVSVTNALYTYGASYDESAGAYVLGDYNPGGRVSYATWYLDEDTEYVTLTASTGDIDDAATFWIVYATPIISRNNGRPISGKTGASCGIVTFQAE